MVKLGAARIFSRQIEQIVKPSTSIIFCAAYRLPRCRVCPDMEPLRPLPEVAKQLGISPQTLRRRIREAGLHPARPGRTLLLSEVEIGKILDESRWRKVRGGAAGVLANCHDRQQLKDALTQLQDELFAENGMDHSTQS